VNNELKTMLETIIQEALRPVRDEMQTIKDEVQTIKGEVKTIKSQVDENTQLIKAIIHRQDETDAKLDAISMDVHKLHGELNFIKEEISDIKTTVDFTYQKTNKNELEIFKLKQD